MRRPRRRRPGCHARSGRPAGGGRWPRPRRDPQRTRWPTPRPRRVATPLPPRTAPWGTTALAAAAAAGVERRRAAAAAAFAHEPLARGVGRGGAHGGPAAAAAGGWRRPGPPSAPCFGRPTPDGGGVGGVARGWRPPHGKEEGVANGRASLGKGGGHRVGRGGPCRSRPDGRGGARWRRCRGVCTCGRLQTPPARGSSQFAWMGTRRVGGGARWRNRRRSRKWRCAVARGGRRCG